MITKSTVFILGAGTSMPYGFPSGGQLVKQICGATAGIQFEDDQSGYLSKGEIAQILQDVFGIHKREEFGNALHFSQKYSIDTFLERRPEFMEIGKWAIALFILRKEISGNLFSFENQDKGCYRYLASKLDASWDALRDNKVSFVTFNYDRSLEHFLFTTFQNSYGKSETESAEMVNQISISHVHGSLGKLPWQTSGGLPYGASMDYYKEHRSGIANGAANTASKQIKVIPENQSTSDEFENAYKLLSSSERIYFLGFGYHPINLTRLRIQELAKQERARTTGDSRQSRMKGSAMGLELAEAEKVKEWFIDIRDNSDSLLFLRKFADL